MESDPKPAASFDGSASRVELPIEGTPEGANHLPVLFALRDPPFVTGTGHHVRVNYRQRKLAARYQTGATAPLQFAATELAGIVDRSCRMNPTMESTATAPAV